MLKLNYIQFLDKHILAGNVVYPQEDPFIYTRDGLRERHIVRLAQIYDANSLFIKNRAGFFK